jgi:UDP-N-acetylmuramoyl-tripeptide--D-alanyl-D-alanine ligase
VDADPFVKVKAENGDILETNLIGTYNFENIAAALCIGKYFKVDAGLAHRAIGAYQPSNMRSQLVKKDSNTIILDAYNANPSSMKVAIENIAAIKGNRKTLILGDMFELEEEAEAEHRGIGKLLRSYQFENVILCGRLMKFAKEEYSPAVLFETKDELIAGLKNNPIKDSIILVKASRGIGLETVVEFL